MNICSPVKFLTICFPVMIIVTIITYKIENHSQIEIDNYSQFHK